MNDKRVEMKREVKVKWRICELWPVWSAFLCVRRHHCIRLCHFDLNHLQWNDIEAIFLLLLVGRFVIFLPILNHHYCSVDIVLFLSFMQCSFQLSPFFGGEPSILCFWFHKSIQRRLSIDKASRSVHGVKRKSNQVEYNERIVCVSCGTNISHFIHAIQLFVNQKKRGLAFYAFCKYFCALCLDIKVS